MEDTKYDRFLFSLDGPTKTIPAMNMNFCKEGHLTLCMVPDNARDYLANMTKVRVFGEPIYVRGVSSVFLSVETQEGKNYYVHERFIRT